MLGGLLAGVTTCGVLMAIFQSNAGGAWDNAKKMIEEQGRKGTAAHKAAVVGDTVGDPFKDTSGPSLNILLKLMSVVALVIAPSIALDTEAISAYNTDNAPIEMFEQITEDIEVTVNDNGDKIAVVTTTTTVKGDEKIETITLEGDDVDKIEEKRKK